MHVQFLGSGDAFGSGGRFNTCFYVTVAGGAFLIDCGASSLIAMRKFGVDPNGVQTVFVSHLHGDHFGGLPFLILDAQFYSRRNVPLALVGPPGFKDRLIQAMEVFFPGSSTAPRRFATDTLELEAGETATINGVTVTTYAVEHACGAPPFALRFSCDGKVLAYTGDTEWTENLLAAGRDADLLIAEALFFERKIKHHLDYATLKANLDRIGARRVVLTHMGPDMLAHIGEVSEEIAEDGKTVVV
jgi:ribonuclease BN (tRNA processing enzyme)